MGCVMNTEWESHLAQLITCMSELDDTEVISALNHVRMQLHQISPFKDEPVDCVLWLSQRQVKANDYNPNVMAPIEQRLLHTSLKAEGYTQPIVVRNARVGYDVVDGYHRMQLGKHKKDLQKRLKGYLPAVVLSELQSNGEERAATIRHNRARGQHQIAAMSDIVRDLSRLGWSDSRIAQELGMENDEVLRLKQISGLVELFSDEDFSTAWTVR